MFMYSGSFCLQQVSVWGVIARRASCFDLSFGGMVWRFLSAFIPEDRPQKMDVVTDATPAAPRPLGTPSVDEEVGIPSAARAAPQDKTEQNQNTSQRGPRANNTSRKKKILSDHENPKPRQKSSPKNMMASQNIFNNCTRFHFGNTINISNKTFLKHHQDNRDDDDDDDDDNMPEHINNLTLLKRCAERKDLHTVAMAITPEGFKKLCKLLGIKNEAKRILEDYRREGFYQVVFKALEHWSNITQCTTTGSTGAMLNVLCIHLWHKDVRKNGGLEALTRLAKDEFSESKNY